jgi:hypothetical protein
MFPTRLGRACAAAALALIAAPRVAAAQPVVDPAGDFLPTFTGPFNGDLDVLSAGVFFDGANFIFRSTQNGPINTTPGALDAWGVNRGTGIPGFAAPPISLPGILFDAVVVLDPGGTSRVVYLTGGAPALLPLGAVTFAGGLLEAVVPAALLPSTGFALLDYTANLWPRLLPPPGNEDSISDFAPNATNLGVTAIPEPSAALLLAPALLAVAAARRRRTR